MPMPLRKPWPSRLLLVVLVASATGLFAQSAARTRAQEATPVAAGQTWHVQVNNISPAGENWSYEAFYPDRLRAHPGDTIVFTLAPNSLAFHTVMVLAQGLTPMEMYQGFSGGFLQPDLGRSGQWQSTVFTNEAYTPCGRATQDPCPIAHIEDVDFGTNSGVLVNPPRNGAGTGNTTFTVVLDPDLPLGPYYVTSIVDGPTMSARIDVVAPDQPVQSADDLVATAARQYQADLAWLAGQDRVRNPEEASNRDGTKTWQVSAGNGSQDRPWLSIDEFAPAQMVIVEGDTVTWTNHSPAAIAHTVSGFADTPQAVPPLNPYQAGCLTSDGTLKLPPPGSFPPDIWNGCPGAEVYEFTDFSQPSAPSGEPYVDGPRTSGILLNEAYLNSPIGDGLPFASSYSITFPNPGIYHYACAIHPGMTGTVVVIPHPMPR